MILLPYKIILLRYSMLKKILILITVLSFTAYIAAAQQYSTGLENSYNKFKNNCITFLNRQDTPKKIKKELRTSLIRITDYYKNGSLTENLLAEEIQHLQKKVNPEIVQGMKVVKNIPDMPDMPENLYDRTLDGNLQKLLNDPNASEEIKAQARNIMRQTRQYYSGAGNTGNYMTEISNQEDFDKKRAEKFDNIENGLKLGSVTYKLIPFSYNEPGIMTKNLIKKYVKACSKMKMGLVTLHNAEYLCNRTSSISSNYMCKEDLLYGNYPETTNCPINSGLTFPAVSSYSSEEYYEVSCVNGEFHKKKIITTEEIAGRNVSTFSHSSYEDNPAALYFKRAILCATSL